MKTIIILPARMASTRLPNKPLADILGTPMIIRAALCAKASALGEVMVAAGDQEIIDVCKDYGINAIATDPDLPSGTDRIYEAFCTLPNKDDYEYIINLQGDLPVIDPMYLEKALNVVKKGSFDIGTLVTKIHDEESRNNPNLVKATFGDNMRALYFSRLAVPYNASEYFSHIGIYVYTAKSLARFVSLPEGKIEKIEKLEQLRALENGMSIGVDIVDKTPMSVDTQEDLDEVIKFLKENNS